MPQYSVKPWKFLLLTFGCKVNQYESEAIREAWFNLGGIETSRIEDADLICINSCAITSKGELDCRAAIAQVRRKNSAAKIILTGCAAKLYPNLPLNDPNRPNLILDQKDKASLLNDPWTMFKASTTDQDLQNCPSNLLKPTLPLHFDSGNAKLYPPFSIATYKRARAVLKIQDGCTHRCTYCIVPSLRKNLSSRHPHEIIAEAKRLCLNGFAEIIISGINLKQYGLDQPEFGNFWSLIAHLERELATNFSKPPRIRLSSIEPSQLTTQGLEVLAQSKLLCPQLHISLQHASQRILKRMGRGHYRPEILVDAMDKIGQSWPRFGLGCDIIVGFPGEEEADYQELFNFCQELPFTYAHVFPYSPRPNTPAALFDGKVEYKTKMERAAKLRKLFAEKNLEFSKSLLNQKVQLHVIADSTQPKDSHEQKGVAEYYIQCSFHPLKTYDHNIHNAIPEKITAKGLFVKICD